MTKKCEVCKAPFQAVRPQAKYCGATCRKRAQRGISSPPPQPSSTEGRTESADDNSLVKAIRTELDEAGVLDTRMGQQALRMAEQMSGRETAGGLAALSKELSRVTAEALRSATSTAVGRVDELKKRREDKAKLAG